MVIFDLVTDTVFIRDFGLGIFFHCFRFPEMMEALLKIL
jgi:hypothetical protein